MVRGVMGPNGKIDVTIPIRCICRNINLQYLFQFLWVEFDHTDELGMFECSVIDFDARLVLEIFQYLGSKRRAFASQYLP